VVGPAARGGAGDRTFAGAGAAVVVEGGAGGGGGGGAGAVHDPVIPTTGSFSGSEIDDSGVPGGTFTVNVIECPPTSVTVTTHWSAAALPAVNRREPIAHNAAREPAAAATILAFRILLVVAGFERMVSRSCVRMGRPDGD
jgi:hypothetical protein